MALTLIDCPPLSKPHKPKSKPKPAKLKPRKT